MLTGQEIADLAAEISKQTKSQSAQLDELLKAVDNFSSTIRSIQPCEMTSLALVGMDAGSNLLKFDPFMIQVVRVVDSSRKSHFRQVLSAEMSRSDLSKAQFKPDGTPATPLGRLMQDLGCKTLPELSRTILPDDQEAPRGWIRDFRVLAEWATLYTAVMEETGAYDRLFIVGTLLRNKMFRGNTEPLFIKMWKLMQTHIAKVEQDTNSRIRIAGFMESTQVLNRYRLALALRGTFARPYSCYSPVPQAVEEASYKWAEWARTPAEELDGKEDAKFAAGKLHFAKFGKEPTDQVYCIDLPWFQADPETASETMSFLLRDAQVGFPLPYVPSSLQRAKEYAGIEGLDASLMQRQVLDAVESVIPDAQRPNFHRFQFENPGNAHVKND